MLHPLPARWIVIGNSGSGKSTLADRLGKARHLPVYDLDLVHWYPDGRKRDEADAKARVAEIAATDTWVMDGVYGWLAQVALVRATLLIWLDLPWDECRSGLLARCLRRGMTLNDQQELLAWAENYIGSGPPRRRSQATNASIGRSWATKRVCARATT